MPYDERWLTEVLAKGQVRLVGDSAPPVPAVLSEKAFMAAVVRLARQHGWYPYHTTDSRRSPSGYPDLTLVHPARRIAIWSEIKVPGGVLTLKQAHWLSALQEVERTEAYLWMPEDWPGIEEKLKG